MGGPDLFAVFFMLLMAISGGSSNNDALDMLPTDSYWRVKHVTVTLEQLQADVGTAKAVGGDIPKLVKELESLSRRDAAKAQLEAIGAPALDALRDESDSPDPEAAGMARDIVKKITGHNKEADIRRLMAIRTLGERKEKAALPLLKSLADSKELFVADYAARAIAQIEGTPLKPVDHHADLAGDLNMLPADTGIIAQTTGLGAPGFTLESLMNQAAAMNPGAAPNPADKQNKIDELTQKLLDIAESTGNVRADGVTLAVSSDIGGSREWVVASFHGLYDREAVSQYVANSVARGRAGAAPIRDGDLITVHFDREAELLCTSNRQMILLTANPANTPAATVADPIIAALTGGKSGLLAETPMDALIKKIDKSGPLWAAAIPSNTMRRMPAFAPFDGISLSSKEDKDGIHLTATARGTGDLQAAADQVTSLRDTLANDLKNEVNNVKDLLPLLEGMQSVKVTIDEKTSTASATATLARDITKSLLVGVLSEMRVMAPPQRGEIRIQGGNLGPNGLP